MKMLISSNSCKKNMQHDFILTQILQELREVKKQNSEIQKDLDLLTLSHKTVVSEDYMMKLNPVDFTQSSWYKDLMSLEETDSSKDLLSISEIIDEEIKKINEESKQLIEDCKKKRLMTVDYHFPSISKLNKNISIFIKNLRR